MPVRISALLLLAAALLAPPAGAAEVEQVIYLHEYSGGLHILPETIAANVGDTLKITVANEGKSPHNLLFCGDGSSPLEKCDNPWGVSAMIPAGETAPMTVELTKAGTFDYYCPIAGHKGGGMGGTLTVLGAAEEKTVSGHGALAALLALSAAVLLFRRR